MPNPDKHEQRAREWLRANQFHVLTGEEPKEVASLAALLRRTKIEELRHIASILRGPLVREGHIGDGRLLEHVESRIAALTRPAGEGE